MKRLKLINHLGEVELELDVYVEGQDLDWSIPVPKPIWLSRVVVQDSDKPLEGKVDTVLEETKELVVEAGQKVEDTKQREKDMRQAAVDAGYLEPDVEAAMAVKRECSECNWIGTQGECDYGHHDFVCPYCGKEALKEVKNEPETIDDKSSRKRRTGKTDSSKDSKKLSKKSARGEGSKGNK